MPSSGSNNQSRQPSASEEAGETRRRRTGLLESIKTSTKEAKNALLQQRLKSWQPVMTPKYAKIKSLYLLYLTVGLSDRLA